MEGTREGEWAKSGEVVVLPADTRIGPLLRVPVEMGHAVVREVPYSPTEAETEVVGMRHGTVWLPVVRGRDGVLLLYALTPQTGPLTKFVVRIVGTNDTVYDPGQYLGSYPWRGHEFHVFVRPA